MPVFKSSRKVQKSGSSLAVTLPAMFVKANEIEKGLLINVYYNLNGVLVLSNCGDPKNTRKCLIEIAKKLEEKVQQT